MPAFDAHLAAALDRLTMRGERRHHRPCVPQAGGMVFRNGRELVDFSSNDYLGLLDHGLIAQRAAETASIAFADRMPCRPAAAGR